MKRKLFLLPITLTALTPAISLVGCGNPEPEYHSYEFKVFGTANYVTDKLTLSKNNYYRFWVNGITGNRNTSFGFTYDFTTPLLVNVDNVRVLKNGNEIPFTVEKTEVYWVIAFTTGEPPTNLEIYLRCNETIENVYGMC